MRLSVQGRRCPSVWVMYGNVSGGAAAARGNLRLAGLMAARPAPGEVPRSCCVRSGVPSPGCGHRERGGADAERCPGPGFLTPSSNMKMDGSSRQDIYLLQGWMLTCCNSGPSQGGHTLISHPNVIRRHI